MRPELHESRLQRIVIAITTRTLAAFLVLSFLATLLPAGAVVAQSVMACCRGKSASHCHSGFKPKKTTSVGSSCKMDCCGYCATAQQTRRERTAAQTAIRVTSPVVISSPVTNVTLSPTFRDEWAPIIPRGPPGSFIEQIS